MAAGPTLVLAAPAPATVIPSAKILAPPAAWRLDWVTDVRTITDTDGFEAAYEIGERYLRLDRKRYFPAMPYREIMEAQEEVGMFVSLQSIKRLSPDFPDRISGYILNSCGDVWVKGALNVCLREGLGCELDESWSCFPPC